MSSSLILVSVRLDVNVLEYKRSLYRLGRYFEDIISTYEVGSCETKGLRAYGDVEMCDGTVGAV